MKINLYFIQWICNKISKIKRDIEYRKKIKKLRKTNPFIY